MRLFLIFIAFLVILATLLPLIRTGAWWVRSFDFPRGQLAVIGVVVLLALPIATPSLTSFDFWVLAVLFLSISYLGYRIFPYMPVAPKQAPSAGNEEVDATIRLLCANVLQSNRDASGFLQRVTHRQPDLILVVETDAWWERALAPLEETYPFQIKHPLDNTYGMMLYSRLRIRSQEVRFLLDEDIPSIFTTVVLPSGREVEVIGIHPRPPRPDKMQDSTDRDAELLIVARYAAHKECPLIVAGDFNDVAWSHTTRLFQRISGLLDPRRGRGLFNTFHAEYPFFRYPLDHIFHTHHFRVQAIERLGYIGSDHFPMYAELCFREEARDPQREPEVDERDDEEAKQIIREVFV